MTTLREDMSGEEFTLEEILEERVCDPYCVACGGLVGFVDIYGDRCRIVSPWDMEPDPKDPLEWGGIFRAIFQPESGSRFRLSGIGRYAGIGSMYETRLGTNFKNYFKVTWDRDASSIVRPAVGDSTRTIYELNFINSNNEQRYPRGHVVHSNCWTLIERLIGPEVENNLELLLEICRERFHENPYNIHEYEKAEEGGPTSQPDLRWWDPFKLAPPLWIYNPHPDVKEDPKQSVPLQDPLNTPDIQRLIRHSVQNKAREVTKRKTRRWSSSIAGSSPIPNERARSSQYHQVSELTSELVFMILDNLSCPTDIRNALIAFNWKIPEVYWKSRLPVNVIFELQDGQRPDSLDWKSLYLEFSDLVEKLPTVKNRKRVVELIDEIGRRFKRRMTESDMPVIDN